MAADGRTSKIGELEKAGSVFSGCWAEVIVLTLYLSDTCMYIQKNGISEQQRSSRYWTCERGECQALQDDRHADTLDKANVDDFSVLTDTSISAVMIGMTVTSGKVGLN